MLSGAVKMHPQDAILGRPSPDLLPVQLPTTALSVQEVGQDQSVALIHRLSLLTSIQSHAGREALSLADRLRLRNAAPESPK